MEVVKIPVEKIELPEVNLKPMTDEEFSLLVKSIREIGYAEPIQVVKWGDKYRIVNGAHRFRALKDVLGYTEIECVVLGEVGKDGWDEMRYWMEAIRLNNIRGDFDIKLLSRKVLEIYEKTKHLYDKEELKRRLGFAGPKSQFDRILERMSSSLPPDMRKRLKEVKGEIGTVEDLMEALRRIMRESGKTANLNFLIFTFGGRESLVVRCDPHLWTLAKTLAKKCEREQIDMRDWFKAILSRELGIEGGAYE